MVSLSDSASLARGKAIYDEVRAGRFQHSWCKLVLTDGTNTLEVMVSCDALRMPVSTSAVDGEFSGNAVRVNVDAYTQQEIADELDALLLTPKLVDEIYRRSPKLPPSTRTPGARMASTRDMILHSEAVDKKIAAIGGVAAPTVGETPAANVGKDWVIARAIFTPSAIANNRSANYGWLGTGSDRSVTGLPIIQSIGTRHTAGEQGSMGHTDYSQVIRVAHRVALLNGQPVDLADVYMGQAGGTLLVSSEGPLPSARIPQMDGVKTVSPLPPPPEGPPPPPEEPPTPGGPPPPPAPPPAVKAKTDPGRVVGGGIVGAGLGYAVGGPAGALIGTLLGGLFGAAAKKKKKRSA